MKKMIFALLLICPMMAAADPAPPLPKTVFLVNDVVSFGDGMGDDGDSSDSIGSSGGTTDMRDAPAPEPAGKWIPLGGKFGKDSEFQFGLNKYAGIGGEVLDERMESQFLSGPAIDPFALMFKSSAAFTLGAAVLYNAEHGNATYSIQPGFVLTPMVQAVLSKTIERLPYLARITDIKVPKIIMYAGGITRFYLSFGYRPNSSPDIAHVCRQKLGVPFDCTAGFGVRIDGTDAVEWAANLIKNGSLVETHIGE